MQLEIDFRSDRPIYLQIAEQIQRCIVSGELKPGDQLPTVRQLATTLKVNFNTIARAYRLLDEAGLISTQHGRGTFVWEQPSNEISQRLRRQALDEITQHYLAEAQRWGYTLQEIAQATAAAIESRLAHSAQQREHQEKAQG